MKGTMKFSIYQQICDPETFFLQFCITYINYIKFKYLRPKGHLSENLSRKSFSSILMQAMWKSRWQIGHLYALFPLFSLQTMQLSHILMEFSKMNPQISERSMTSFPCLYKNVPFDIYCWKCFMTLMPHDQLSRCCMCFEHSKVQSSVCCPFAP